MNKKSFWLGFGVGVLFTAVILGVSCLIRTSDAGIISRAKKMGMVFEKTTDAEEMAQQTEGAEKTAKPSKDKNTAASKTEKKAGTEATENPKSVPTPEGADTVEKSTPKPTKNSMSDEKDKLEKDVRASAKRLEIKAGDWSSTVSKTLEEMGIVKSAKDFDLYLNQNGYSESINAGSYTVSPDDTYQELARKITGK